MKNQNTLSKFILSQLVRPFRQVATLMGSVLGAFLILAATEKVINLPLNRFLIDVLDFYKVTVRQPTLWALAKVGILVLPWVPDLIFLYVFFGVATIRSLSSVYNRERERVVKGLWGRFSNNRLMCSLYKLPIIGEGVYQSLAILLWPLIATEYLFIYKYVWRRYMDKNHSPDFDAEIGSFTSRSKKRANLLYNDVIGYDLETDTWWRLEGDFRLLFLGNILLSLLSFAVLLILGSLGF